MKKLGLLFFAINLCSGAVIAQERPHSIFVNAGSGTLEVEESGDINFILQLGYRFQFNENISIDLRNTRSEATGFGTLFSADLDFSLNTIAAQYRKNLGGHNFAYVSLGASYYDWEFADKAFTSKVVKRVEDNGVDIYYGVGYKYEFDVIDLGAEYQVMQMADMDSKIFTINLGYRF